MYANCYYRSFWLWFVYNAAVKERLRCQFDVISWVPTSEQIPPVHACIYRQDQALSPLPRDWAVCPSIYHTSLRLWALRTDQRHLQTANGDWSGTKSMAAPQWNVCHPCVFCRVFVSRSVIHLWSVCACVCVCPPTGDTNQHAFESGRTSVKWIVPVQLQLAPFLLREQFVGWCMRDGTRRWTCSWILWWSPAPPVHVSALLQACKWITGGCKRQWMWSRRSRLWHAPSTVAFISAKRHADTRCCGPVGVQEGKWTSTAWCLWVSTLLHHPYCLIHSPQSRARLSFNCKLCFKESASVK